MQDKEVLFPKAIYSEYLATINGIKFTNREIDVIACLLSARRTSQIASILSIAPRTVTTHFRNIMLRLDCNTQEGIISFIEKSHKLPFLRDYYAGLITEVAFEKSLKEVSKLKHEGSPHGLVIYWEDENQKQILLTHLEGHLRLAGFNAEVREYTGTSKPEPTEDPYPISLLFAKKDLSLPHPELEELYSLDLTELSNYYYSVFELLKKLLPKADISRVFSTFRDHSESLQGSYRGKVIRERVPEKRESKETSSLDKILQIFKNRKWPLGAGIICISFLIIGCWIFRGKEGQGITANSHQTASSRKDDLIRSDLVIPTEAVLLNRPELITEIDNKLKNQHGIQTVALVGPGGAGKTTLSRQYAHEQKASAIWEVNAETIESLRLSFENLAQALAKREEDKNSLRQIQNLKDPELRERKIIQFVREQLLTHPNWLLVFDNVENFSDIQKYFPQDAATWGQGKIILTTRNHNIENNKHINSILQIGELTPDQKVKFFIKIASHGKEALFTSLQTEELKAFLEHIPPFPLDVSVAAFYLKATQILYTAYLENLSKCNKDFESVQKNLLKEAGDYMKTRYGIISLSLQHMINTHKHFRDLLLFISLLDSQNIPRDLLDLFKDKTIVDSFIYNLKKHSLITSEVVLPLGARLSFSIHRSTQLITLAYLTRLLNLEKNKHLTERIGITFKSYVAKEIDKEDFAQMSSLVNHCEKFLKHSNLLSNNIRGFIAGKLGCIYYYLSDYMQSKIILEKSLEDLKKSSGEDYTEVSHILVYLGNVYRTLGDYKKAINVFEQSLTIYAKQSKNYSEVALPLGYLGILHGEMENYKKGINLLEQTLAIHKKYAAHYSAVGRDLGYLGIFYREIGNYKKAKDLLEQSLWIYKKSPSNYIPIAWILANLGMLYVKEGNYERAKSILEQSLLVYKKHSKNHIVGGEALLYLGILYKKIGNYEKAKDLLEQSLWIYKKHNHADIFLVFVHLAEAYRGLGNYEKAKNLLEQSLLIYRKNFSENHIHIAQALKCLGYVCIGLGNYKEAESLFEQSLRIYRKDYKNDHLETGRILLGLGEASLLRGHMENAEHNFKKASEIFQKNKNPENYTSLECLAKIYLKKFAQSISAGNKKQAENFKKQSLNCLKQALNIVQANFPKDSPHITRIEARLKKLEEETL